MEFFLLLYHCVYVHIHAYYYRRHTDISPSKLKKNCNQISLAFIQPYMLPLHIWSYPPYFSRGLWLAFPLPAVLLPQNSHNQVGEENWSEPPAGTKGLCDKPLVLLPTDLIQTFQRQKETPVTTHQLQQMGSGRNRICSVSTCATSEILTDTTLLKTLYFQHWPMLDLV